MCLPCRHRYINTDYWLPWRPVSVLYFAVELNKTQDPFVEATLAHIPGLCGAVAVARRRFSVQFRVKKLPNSRSEENPACEPFFSSLRRQLKRSEQCSVCSAAASLCQCPAMPSLAGSHPATDVMRNGVIPAVTEALCFRGSRISCQVF